VNPIFKRELQQFLRSERIIATVLLMVAVLGVFLYFLWPRTAVFSMASSASKQVFAVFLICNLAFVLILVPAFCATSITWEKEHNSFVMLYTTLLKPHDILLGKLMASLSMISLLILATLPVSSLCALSGGINLPVLLKAYGVIFASSLTFGILSLAVSAMSERSSSSLVTSYLVIALIAGGTWLPYALLSSQTDLAGTLMSVRSLSPFDAIYSILYPEQYQVTLDAGEGSPLIRYFILSGVLAVVGIGVFIYGFLFRSGARSGKTVERFTDSSKGLKRKLSFPFYLFDPLKRKKPIRNWINPVFVTELRSKILGNPRFVFWSIAICSALSIIIMILATSFVSPDSGTGGFSSIHKASIIYQIGLVALLAPVVCSSSITTEITSGTLVLVRMSRLSALRFVMGKLYASFFYVLLILSCSLPIIISLVSISNEAELGNIVIALGIVLMTTVCLVTAGLCASSFSEQTDSATALSYAFSGLLCLASLSVLLFAENISAKAVGFILTLNPVASALGRTTDTFNGILPEDSWFYNLIFLGSLSVIFISLSSWRVYYLMRRRT